MWGVNLFSISSDHSPRGVQPKECNMRLSAGALAVAVLACAAAPEFALADKIGVASSVKNQVQRVSPAPAQQISGR